MASSSSSSTRSILISPFMFDPMHVPCYVSGCHYHRDILWKNYYKFGTDIFYTFCRDIPSVVGYDFPANGQSDPGSFICRAAIQSLKNIKDFINVLFIKTDPVIFYTNPYKR